MERAPTFYPLFGDKRGLLDAAAEHGFAAYLGEKTVREPGPDPVEDLRIGWDLHIEFGLSRPAAYGIAYGDPRPGAMPAAAAAGYRVLQDHIRRIALAGRLRVPEDRAAYLVHAAGCGTVFTLLSMPEDRRDLGLSTAAREATIAAISTGRPSVGSGSVAAAVALRATLSDTTALTDAERGLLEEWLERLASG